MIFQKGGKKDVLSKHLLFLAQESSVERDDIQDPFSEVSFL